MVSRIFLVLSAALVIVHGSEITTKPTGSPTTGSSTTGSPTTSPPTGSTTTASGERYSTTGSTPASTSQKSPSQVGSYSQSSASNSAELVKSSNGNVQSYSGEVSSVEGPVSANLLNGELESSGSNSKETVVKKDSKKKDSEEEDSEEPSPKTGNQTESISGSDEDSGSHAAQQMGKQNATTPRPTGQSSNSSVIMTIPSKAPTLLPKQNSTNPATNSTKNNSTGGVPLQSPAQGSAVQATYSGLAILAVSVLLVVSR